MCGVHPRIQASRRLWAGPGTNPTGLLKPSGSQCFWSTTMRLLLSVRSNTRVLPHIRARATVVCKRSISEAVEGCAGSSGRLSRGKLPHLRNLEPLRPSASNAFRTPSTRLHFRPGTRRSLASARSDLGRHRNTRRANAVIGDAGGVDAPLPGRSRRRGRHGRRWRWRGGQAHRGRQRRRVVRAHPRGPGQPGLTRLGLGPSSSEIE